MKNANDRPVYRELYHVSSGGKTLVSVVEDEGSGKIYYRKVLSVYNVKVFAYLKEHACPYIPKIFNFVEEEGKLTVIEEMVRGETLDFVLQNRDLKKKEKIRILLNVCDALIFLHSAKPYPIIHRDLKPSNVMIADDGRACLIDYDAAKVFAPGRTKDTELIGTQGSAAPEQYGFAQSDVRTDIYALGVMIGMMFPKDFRMQRIAARATKLSPDDRFQSVKQIRERIGRKGIPRMRPADSRALECFCTNCGAILNDQPGFEYNDGTWICTECGQQLFGDEAGDTGGKMNGVIWYCDGCGAILNKQDGFDYYDDTWICRKCGFRNDISENNIRPEPLRK